MKLSIVIVNYNVRHFLEQCLLSVERALQGLEAEVFVVDNHSADGSVALVRERFPWVQLLANTDNPGFSRANNQAIRVSSGQYVLLLNPDTVVEEDTFRKVVAFMDQHPEAGGLGVKMVNGEGEFLPESKRALPTPWVAFYKIFGLAALFPRSRKFGQYHLSYLSKDETHSVEILSGAFMLLRKSVLDEIGLLDETFFMYGEDIDLSYRILLAGYRNYYYPHATIIHYKGESTKKGSLNYVLVFYRAMLIFARKHFSQGRQRSYLAFVRLAIYLRALLAVLRRVVSRLGFPLMEALLFWGAALGIKQLWGTLVRPDVVYPPAFDFGVAPLWALVYVLFLAAWGAYRPPYRLRRVLLGVFYAFLMLAVVTWLFKPINFSRGILSLTAGSVLLLTLSLRAWLNARRLGAAFWQHSPRLRTLLVGQGDEVARVRRLLQQDVDHSGELVGAVAAPNRQDLPSQWGGLPTLGRFEQLAEVVRVNQVEEVVFCNAGLPTQEIIRQMVLLRSSGAQFKIVPPQAEYLIGPNQILTAARETAQLMRLYLPEVRQQKRLFELGAAVGLLLVWPFTCWAYQTPSRAGRNLLQVLLGQRQLVGYAQADTQGELPPLKPALLDLRLLQGNVQTNPAGHAAPAPGLADVGAQNTGLDRHYARNYRVGMDWQVLLRGWRFLGKAV